MAAAKLNCSSHLCSQAQHLLHKFLGLSGLFQEQFHNCRQKLQLHLPDKNNTNSEHLHPQEHRQKLIPGPSWSKSFKDKPIIPSNPPECFRHGNPPKSSPAVRQHCQYAQHTLPRSRSWQHEPLAHLGSPSFRTEWRSHSRTWMATQHNISRCPISNTGTHYRHILGDVTVLRSSMITFVSQMGLTY